MNEPKRIAILGSTGSIGCQALEIVRSLSDRLCVVGLSAGGNHELLAKQIADFEPKYYSARDAGSASAGRVRAAAASAGTVLTSMEDMVVQPDVDLVLVATVGRAGLGPTLAAIRACKSVALANKEVLVMAGSLVMAEATRHGVEILPVDSEHSAIWQCLWGEGNGKGHPDEYVSKVYLTASGGAFRDLPTEMLAAVTPEQALAHPTWRMGPKVTVDSATLANKGFEVIEAHWLFHVPYSRIEVVAHRESIVHSMVEFVDGSIKAQMGPPDMRMAIQCALTYPDRARSAWPKLNLLGGLSLNFGSVDYGKYPCLRLCLEAARKGQTYPVVLSAVDEYAVGAFLRREIGFPDIARLIETVLQEHAPRTVATLDDVWEAESWATRRASELSRNLG